MSDHYDVSAFMDQRIALFRAGLNKKDRAAFCVIIGKICDFYKAMIERELIDIVSHCQQRIAEVNDE